MNPEAGEISIQQAKIYLALASGSEWLTAKEVAEKASVVGRTVRFHLNKFIKAGLLARIELHPAQYKLVSYADNHIYTKRLEQACKIFGLTV